MIITIKTNEPAEYTYTHAVQLVTEGNTAKILYLSGGVTFSEATFQVPTITKFATYESPNS